MSHDSGEQSRALLSLFSADFDPLYDMFADLSHRKFSSGLDTVIIESFEYGKLCAHIFTPKTQFQSNFMVICYVLHYY